MGVALLENRFSAALKFSMNFHQLNLKYPTQRIESRNIGQYDDQCALLLAETFLFQNKKYDSVRII